MESYGKFARVYDMFQDNVNYRKWADYIRNTETGADRGWSDSGTWMWDGNGYRDACGCGI